MTAPTDRDVAQMLVDQQMGRPFTGPAEWQPMWDQIALELAEMPEGAVVDVPFDPEPADLESRAEGARLVAALEEGMQPVPTKIVCWRAATAGVFPPDGDPTRYVGNTYQEAGFVSVTTHRDHVVVPDGGRLVAVVVPAGTPVAYDPENHELVLARDLTYRVVSVAPNGTVKVVITDPPIVKET